MIPSAVFVKAIAMRTKLSLYSKFSRSLGNMSKTSTHVLSTSRKPMTGFLVKSVGEFYRTVALTAVYYCPSNHC